MYQKRYSSFNKSPDKSQGPVVDEKRIYNYAIKLLTGRDYSEVKLKEKLRLKNFDKIVVEKVIAEIKERGFLREESYLEARIKAFMHKVIKSDTLIVTSQIKFAGLKSCQRQFR